MIAEVAFTTIAGRGACIQIFTSATTGHRIRHTLVGMARFGPGAIIAGDTLTVRRGGAWHVSFASATTGHRVSDTRRAVVLVMIPFSGRTSLTRTV